MLDRVTGWLHTRLGSRSWLVLVAGEGGVSVFVAVLTTAVISSYYDAGLRNGALLALTGSVFTLAAVGWATWRARGDIAVVTAWREAPVHTPTDTAGAWTAATTLTLRQYRRDSWRVNVFAVVPTSVVAIRLLDLRWQDFLAVVLACVIPAAYATVLSYSVGEALSRPLVAEIAAELPDDFAFERHGLPVHKRLHLGLPAYTAATGLLVATVVGDRDGSGSLVRDVLVAGAVGLALSAELATLLARAITRPVEQVRGAMATVQDGQYDARVPVVTSDELGELAHDFNRMAQGLEEREHIRAAFGTYLDKSVAQIILSGQFPTEGVEVDVSILFCDVRGFTSYAESAPATEVIAALNRLFAVAVPVVDRHGGHIDKFIGDGLLAVFGAPEAWPDHADRAVAAACEIVRAVRDAAIGLDVAAGVNSGRVVAGSVGGAGRLNFSVIGDAVNVAARVEAATRQTGDDVLLTEATRSRMLRATDLVSRGALPLKGKALPVELFAPTSPVVARA